MKKLKREAKKTAIVFVRTTPSERKRLREMARLCAVSEAEIVRAALAAEYGRLEAALEAARRTAEAA